MIPSLTPVTIGGAPPELRLYVALAERAGFSAVDLDLDTVLDEMQNSSEDRGRALFEQFEIAPASGGLSVEWRGGGEKGEQAFQSTIASLPNLAKAAQQIGCRRICTWLPPAIDDDPDEFRSRSAARFRRIAEILADHDLHLGLEYVAPETLRRGPQAMGAHEFVHTLPQTLDFIAEIDAPAKNVGLLLDSFHWFCAGSDIDELAALTPAQIVHVHINDAPNLPLTDQLDHQRLLPGDGVINLRAFLTTLAKLGYREFVGVEVFNDGLKSQGREAAAELAGESMERLFSQVFAGPG